jgi:hypothetical protein
MRASARTALDAALKPRSDEATKGSIQRLVLNTAEEDQLSSTILIAAALRDEQHGIWARRL